MGRIHWEFSIRILHAKNLSILQYCSSKVDAIWSTGSEKINRESMQILCCRFSPLTLMAEVKICIKSAMKCIVAVFKICNQGFCCESATNPKQNPSLWISNPLLFHFQNPQENPHDLVWICHWKFPYRIAVDFLSAYLDGKSAAFPCHLEVPFILRSSTDQFLTTLYYS